MTLLVLSYNVVRKYVSNIKTLRIQSKFNCVYRINTQLDILRSKTIKQ